MAEPNIVAGLFGMTPDIYQRQQYQQDLRQGYDLAQLEPGAAGRAQLSAGIGQLGRGFAGAMGVEDPQLKMITQTNQLMQSLNLRDPQSLVNAAQQASQMGNTELALKLIDLSDKAQIRMQQIQAQQDALQARNISNEAYQPGGKPTMFGQPTEYPLMDDQGNVMPGAGVTQPSYDVNRVQARLLQTPAGRAELETIYKAQEAAAKTEKLASEAISAREKANLSKPSEQAELALKSANATKAVIESQFTERAQTLGLEEKTWNIKNLRSEIATRGAKLNLDTLSTNATVLEKLAQVNKLNNEIPTDTRKLINESAVTAATAQQSATQFNDLANKIEGLGGYGKFSSLSEYAKATFGAEGYETSLRQEYTRLRNSAAIKSLPPGPATDKDIQMALSGFPKDTSNSANIAQFLRGMAKLQDIDAAVANAKTDWLAQNNGTLTRATKTLVVGDFRARPGESFNELSARIAQDVNARYSGQSQEAQRQSLVNQIPTNQPSGSPSLAAPQNSILQQADAILNKR
jgi:hypothetical protein